MAPTASRGCRIGGIAQQSDWLFFRVGPVPLARQDGLEAVQDGPQAPDGDVSGPCRVQHVLEPTNRLPWDKKGEEPARGGVRVGIADGDGAIDPLDSGFVLKVRAARSESLRRPGG